MAIHFYSEDIPFKIKDTLKTKKWIKEIIDAHNKKLGTINYIFCSDHHLHKMNQLYLNHDTYTDIITFDNAEYEDEIEGDIFISIPRVEENAQLFNKTFDNELRRVLIHGVLHLVGFKDKSKEEELIMRSKEEESLAHYERFT